MRVIGTAGHVDHGKSTLVKALTGIDPDRLKEEKAREMTIDLGFAWFTLPDGEIVGIIDVPGHKDFVGNMLAGVGAISSVIFVIDANEGFMPQTREHLFILDQLHLENGLIALTKCDMVDNPDWFELVIAEIRQDSKGTFLENAPIIKVSAKTGDGIDELKRILAEMLAKAQPPRNIEKPRLSVDRVFTLQGFGTVVTGTLIDGTLHTGEEIFISGKEKHGRIRGLQTHNIKAEEVSPGSRIAVNISGFESGEIKRGDLIQKVLEAGSLRINAWIDLLPQTSRSLKHNEQVKVFHLASEHLGRIRLLGTDEIEPGKGGYVQIEFENPLFARTDDRFIVRFPSPSETIGGGQILQICVRKKYKRFSNDILDMLSTIQNGSLDEKIVEVGNKSIVFSTTDMDTISGYSPIQINQAVSGMVTSGQIFELTTFDLNTKTRKFITKSQLNNLNIKVQEFLKQYHTRYPLRFGATKDELSRSLKLEKETFNLLLILFNEEGIFKNNGCCIHLPDFSVNLTNDHKKKLDVLNKRIDESRYSPPDIPELTSITGQELFDYLLSIGSMIRLTGDIGIRKSEFDEMLSFVKKTVNENGKITVSEFRDAFGNSRKYALAFLEFLDESGITIREGDYRILKTSSKEQA